MTLINRLSDLNTRLTNIPISFGVTQYLPEIVVQDVNTLAYTKILGAKTIQAQASSYRAETVKVGEWVTQNIQILGNEFIISNIPITLDTTLLSTGKWILDATEISPGVWQGEAAKPLYLDRSLIITYSMLVRPISIR